MRCLLLLPNEDNRMVLTVLFEHFGWRVDAPAELELSAEGVLRWLGEGYDFVAMPLSLGYGHAMLFARDVHLLRLQTAIVLYTATLAPPDVLEKLFDLVLHAPCDPRHAVRAIQELLARPRPRHPDPEYLDAACEEIIRAASCFHARMHEGPHPDGLAVFKREWAS